MDRGVDGGVEVRHRREQRTVRAACRVGAVEVGERGAGGPDEVRGERADGHPIECARFVPAGRHLVASDQRGGGLDRFDDQAPHAAPTRLASTRLTPRHRPSVGPDDERAPRRGLLARPTEVDPADAHEVAASSSPRVHDLTATSSSLSSVYGMPLRLVAVTFDAHDPSALAEFWAGVLDRDIVREPTGAFLPRPRSSPREAAPRSRGAARPWPPSTGGTASASTSAPQTSSPRWND